MSDKNFNNIDENFPVPRAPNSTEGFRKNFKLIKDTLIDFSSDIETFKENAFILDDDNDLEGTSLINANLVSPTQQSFEGGEIGQDTQIDFEDGFYQKFTLINNITFFLGEFPKQNKIGMIRLELRGTNRIVEFDTLNEAETIRYDTKFPVEFVLENFDDPVIIEIWYQELTGFYLSYFGKYKDFKIGTVPELPLASGTAFGVVRLGSGLSIGSEGELNVVESRTDLSQFTDNENLLFSGDYRDLFNVPKDIGLSEAFGEDSLQVTGEVATQNSTDTISLNSEVIGNFRIRQKVRVFGASSDTESLTDKGEVLAVKNGFAGANSGDVTLEYMVALFDLANGKYAPVGNISSVTGINTGAFNLANNIILNITRKASNQGVLIYRKINQSVFSLIDVLGSKTLGTAASFQYVDYFSFDRNLWSKKSEFNSYIESTGIVHFPLTAPAVSGKGWVDSEIKSVDQTESTITLENSFFFDSKVVVVHDDTEFLQKEIDDRAEQGIRILSLSNKTYYVSTLIVPNNFFIEGTGTRSLLRKLPWSSSGSILNSVIRSESERANNIRLERFAIDGNMQNQYLIEDSANETSNYAVVVSGSNLVFDRILVGNISGGGIFSTEPQDVLVKNCKIFNSGMSDRNPASPLIADNGTDLFIVDNSFRNFSEGVDLSISNTGIVKGNIVENCGQGILIFGSLRLISSPNLISGPAGEFIPGPDIFNSKFSSVNIIVEPNVTFISDVYVYQENGQLFDLTANRGEVFYRVDKLRKVENVEELYGEVLINGQSPISNFFGLDGSKGEFRFAISADNVDELKTTYSFSTLKQIDENHIGLVYRAIHSEYVLASSINDEIPPIYSSQFNTYEVLLTAINNLNVGARVRFLGHGGSPNLDNTVGVVINLNPTTRRCIIQYDASVNITQVGTGGSLTRENTFLLAKGKIL